jgi:hypothetical protein
MQALEVGDEALETRELRAKAVQGLFQSKK